VKLFSRIQASVFLAAFSLTSVVHAEARPELATTFLAGLLAPKVYTGFKGKIQVQEPDWFCNDRRYFWSVNWQSEIKDVQIQYDANNPDSTSVKIILEGSSVRAQYYTKGGLGCLWSGAEGNLAIGSIAVDFSLKAIANKDFPDISLDGLTIDQFEVSNVQVLYASVFDSGFKRSSNGFGEWIESNLNGLIAGFLKTGLKQRLDKAINKEVDRQLKLREEGPNPGPNAFAPNTVH